MAITQEGRKIFGQWLQKCRLSDRTRTQVKEWLRKTAPYESVGEFVSQTQYANWISALSDTAINTNHISRGERAEGKLPSDFLVALGVSGALFIGDRTASLDDIGDVLSGKLNPLNNHAKR